MCIFYKKIILLDPNLLRSLSSKNFSNQNFGVWFKTDSAVLLIKRKNKESKDSSEYFFEIFKENKDMHTIYFKRDLPIKVLTFT